MGFNSSYPPSFARHFPLNHDGSNLAHFSSSRLANHTAAAFGCHLLWIHMVDVGGYFDNNMSSGPKIGVNKYNQLKINLLILQTILYTSHTSTQIKIPFICFGGRKTWFLLNTSIWSHQLQIFGLRVLRTPHALGGQPPATDPLVTPGHHGPMPMDPCIEWIRMVALVIFFFGKK